jgi:H+-transporting ATPase
MRPEQEVRQQEVRQQEVRQQEVRQQEVRQQVAGFATSVSEQESRHQGLTTAEARLRRQTYGPNSIPEPEPALWRQALAKFWAPVPWMLEAAILLQFMVREYVEAAVIATLLVFNAVLGLLQEGRAQATLRALESRLALLTAVRRDGAWQILPVTELVPGDLVKLTLGGVVPADVQLIAGNILLDQSMLTGESLPVEAGAGARTYAGALVRRGEALAEVTATGAHTEFGKTAQLVGTAHAPSSQQQAVLRVVRNLAGFSAAMVVVQLLYATLTLASAVGARALAARNVLPTRLSAIDEAATIDVLCSDKTGTLTQNALVVTAVHGSPGNDEARVLALAAFASADHGMDPVDAAVRAAAARSAIGEPLARTRFVPFDPAVRTSEAEVVDGQGQSLRVLKGAFATIAALASPPAGVEAGAAALANLGNRVLGVAAGPPGRLAYVGLIALSDPPRPDARGLIVELRSLGVQTVMVTGDAAPTATVVARAVGLEGAVCSGKPPKLARPEDFSVFAGVFPEGKFDMPTAWR